MNSYFLYWDLSWIVIFLFTFETSLATKSNKKIYLNKRNISSIVCYEKEPTHIPIENIKKELDELAEIEKNIHYVRTSKLSGGPDNSIRYFDIDVVAIADYSLFLQFGRAMSLLNPNINKSMIEVGIREEIANMFFGAKRVYLHNQFSIPGMFDFKIVLNLVDIIIFESEEESFLTGIKEGNKVDASQAMGLLNKYAANLVGKQPYDHVALITGNDLIVKRYGNADVAGVAWMQYMCLKDWSISMIEKLLEGYAMLHLVHEIAHSLGATHDGQNNCRADDQYLMTGVSNAYSKTLNKWKFSECSRREIASSISRRLNGGIFDYLNKEVATDADIERVSRDVSDCYTKKIPIQKSVPDVSRRFRGSESELKWQCAFSNYSDAEERCDWHLPSRKSCFIRYCLGEHNGTEVCSPITPYRGTSCAWGKVCEHGYCRSIEELRKVKTDFGSNLTIPASSFKGRSFDAQASSYCSHDNGLTLVIMTLLVCGTLTE